MGPQSNTVLGSPPRSAQDAQEALDSLVMTWAHDIETGEPVYIMELGPDRNGIRCRCECRSCGHPLMAVNAGKAEGTYFQKPHFKHRSGVVKDSCLVLAARAAALRLLTEDGMIDLPSRTRSATWEGLSGSQYEGKAAIQAQRRRLAGFQFRDRTSAVLTLDGGQQVVVQLTGTNVTAERSSAEDSDERATIYIDIDDPRLAGLSPEELRSRLKLLPEPFGWHCHWEDQALDREAASDARAHAREMLDWPDGITDQDLEAVPPELRRETLLHLTVKEILAASGYVEVPALEIHEVAGSGETQASVKAFLVRQQSLSLRNPRLEHRLGKVIPDVCADAMDAEGGSVGLLCIEVTVTHGFDSERLGRLRTANLLTLEVDLSEAYGRISRVDLAKLVVDGLTGKRWLHHPGLLAQREALRAAAVAASEAKVQELRKALRTDPEPATSRAFRSSGSEKPDLFALRATLPSSGEDLARCRTQLRARKSGWTPSEDLLDGLLSLRHGLGIGQHHGLTAGQVAHKLRCTIDTRLHCLVLIALNAYGVDEADRGVVDEWATATREKVRAKEPMWRPPTGALSLLKDLLPELSAAVEKMMGFFSRPTLDVRWTSGEPTAGHLSRANALRRHLYQDGAYRLYAPRIDYDRVLSEARSARSEQRNIAELLAKWSEEYSLGDEFKPILDVLLAAGLIA